MDTDLLCFLALVAVGFDARAAAAANADEKLACCLYANAAASGARAVTQGPSAIADELSSHLLETLVSTA